MHFTLNARALSPAFVNCNVAFDSMVNGPLNVNCSLGSNVILKSPLMSDVVVVASGAAICVRSIDDCLIHNGDSNSWQMNTFENFYTYITSHIYTNRLPALSFYCNSNDT